MPPPTEDVKNWMHMFRWIVKLIRDEYEVDEAELEHIEFQYLVSPVEVLSEDGIHVSGLRVIRNQLGNPDASGRRQGRPVADAVRYLRTTNLPLPDVQNYL